MIFIVLLFFACGLETQIVGVVNPSSDDTSISQEDTIDTSINSEEDTDTEDVRTEDTSESQSELEGIVGYVNYSLQQIACPECVGALREVTLTFSAKFHDPISDSHTRWIPSPGNCIENLQETVPSSNYKDIGSQIDVYGPVHSFSVPRISYGTYETSTLYDTQYDRDGYHSVFSDSLVNGFDFTASRGFDYIEPASLLYVDMSYAYQAPIYRSGADFFWGPSGSEENFMIVVAAYTSTGSALLGYVVCVGEDSGYMNIPSSYLSSYPPGSLVAVHLSRQKVELSPSEDLGGYIETHMEWEVVGTGTIQ